MTRNNQPKNAKDRDQYMQMVSDGVVQWGMNPNMTHEQYEYEMENNEIFLGDGFMIYKTGGKSLSSARSGEKTSGDSLLTNSTNCV